MKDKISILPYQLRSTTCERKASPIQALQVDSSFEHGKKKLLFTIKLTLPCDTWKIV